MARGREEFWEYFLFIEHSPLTHCLQREECLLVNKGLTERRLCLW